MATQVLRPDSTISNTMTVTGALGSANAALSDDTDTTYLDAPYLSYSEVIVAVGDFTLPANTYVKQVRVRFRYSTPGSGAITLWYGRLRDDIGNVITADAFQTLSTAPAEASGGWKTKAPNGADWSQTTINSVRINAYPGYWTGNVKMVRIYEAYVDVDYRFNPTATITSPANNATITDTTRPKTVFTYADSDPGDQMEAYRIKIFSAAQYNAAGFSPDSSQATWDSGKVFAAAPPAGGVAPTVDLFNGTTYRSYVWVYSTGGPAGTTGREVSAAVSTTYTINVTPPAAPNITVSLESNNPTVGLITTSAGAGGAATFTISVERKPDGIDTWEEIKGPVLPGSFNDYTIVPKRNVRYRARAYTSGGIAGPYSAEAGPLFVVDEEWRLKDYVNNENLALSVVGDSVSHTRPEDKAVFSPLGRKRKVSVSDVIKGNEFTLTLEFLTETAFENFEKMRNRQITLLLVRGWTGEQWYVTIGSEPTMELFNYSPTYRQITVSFIEVDP